jgi:hypothetical protein
MKNLWNRLTRRGFMTGAGGVAASLPAPASPAAPIGNTYQLTRRIPVERGYDVVVAGGGPSGAAAAICAARLGAKVLLLEAAGSLGGMGTNAYVSNWYALGDGERIVIGGLISELIALLCEGGYAAPAATQNYRNRKYVGTVGFNPEGLKIVFDRLCQQAGVEVRYFTRVIDADVDARARRVNGIVTNSVEGYRHIQAKTFIDGTGDAVLADLCGVPCRAAGRDTRNIMPPTLCAVIADLDYTRWGKSGSQQAMVEKAIADGYFSQPDRHVPGMMRSGETTATMNAGHLFRTDALQTRSLSDAMLRGRLLVEEYAAFYRKYMAGCENIKVMATGPLLGVRESRRIVGEYELNYADFQARRHFPDQIGVYCKGVDIHVYDLTPEEYKRYYEEFNQADRLKKGESYGLPYGMLAPKGWTNLWVGGRCTSTDIKVNGAIRDQPGCSMLGQAAGTAAVQSIRTGQPACDLDTAKLVETLRQAKANLPQPQLSKRMTRA